MKVAEIMTERVISVRSSARVSQIARIFREHNLSGLPVLDDEDQLVGIVTEVDLISRHARPHLPRYIAFLGVYVPLGSSQFKQDVRRITGVTAADIMTEPVKTIAPDADIEDLATLMVEQKANPVPVVDEAGQMIGIVSRTDLLRVVEELELAMERADRGEEPASGQ